MEIDDIKGLWKEQKAKDTEIKTSGYYSGLLEEIKKNEDKAVRNYKIMSFLMILTIFIIDRTAIERIPDKTVLTWLGFGMVYFAIICILFVSWSTVIKFKINNITESSLEFLKMAREKLTLRNKIRTIGIPFYIALLTAGISLTYIQITERMSFEFRLLTYSLFYLFMIIITVISIRKEKKKYFEKVKPIEDKIDSLLAGEDN